MEAFQSLGSMCEQVLWAIVLGQSAEPLNGTGEYERIVREPSDYTYWNRFVCLGTQKLAQTTTGMTSACSAI